MRSQAKVALRFRLSKGWAWILVLQTMTIAFSLRVPVAVAFALTVSCLPLVVDGREAEQHASIIASTNSPFSVPQARFCLLKASLRGTDDDYDTKLTLVTEMSDDMPENIRQPTEVVIRVSFSLTRLSVLDLQEYGEVIVCVYREAARFWSFEVYGVDERLRPLLLLKGSSYRLPTVIPKYPETGECRLYVLAPSNQGSEIQLYKPVKGALVLEKKVPSSLSPKLKLLIGEN